MGRFILTCCVVATLLSAVLVSDSQADDRTGPVPNAAFSPDVPTVWHKLGIPQSVGRFKKFRESRINRKGNNPQREKTPKLVKLTDPSNLDPEAPKMLQAAAKIKMAEDLAPQKLKALKYLATLGCGCYNDKNAGLVEGAVLEGLDDCTIEVRREALNLVLNQVQGGQCGCQPACNPKSCCTPKIYKKLEEMVNKTTNTGCPAESDSSIRYLAQQVLNACPYPMMEEEIEEKEVVAPAPVKPKADKATESGDAATESGSIEETFGDDDLQGEDPGEVDGDVEDGTFTPLDEVDGFDDGNDGARRSTSRRNQMQQVTFRRSQLPGNSSINAYAPEDREVMQQLEVTGVVRSVRIQDGNATIVFDDPYDFPAGLKVVIATGRDFASFGTVEIAETGTAVISIEDPALTSHLQKTQRVRLGIVK